MSRSRLVKMLYSSQMNLQFPQTASLTEVLLEQNLKNVASNKSAVVDGVTGRVAYTYESIRLGVEKLAIYLHHELHIERGMRISLLATNSVRQLSCVPGSVADSPYARFITLCSSTALSLRAPPWQH